MNDALTLAAQHEISACDGAYVVLAQQLDTLLVTADSKLVNAVGNPERIIGLENLRL